MKTLRADDWQFYTPKKDGDRSCLLELPNMANVDVEVRAVKPITLNAITKNGETLFLGQGVHTAYSNRMEGFAALEIVAAGLFAYRSSVSSNWLEKVDPQRLTVTVDENANKPMIDLLKTELSKYVGQLEARNALANDVDVAELLDDIDQGDYEFEAEPDPFGIGYEEPDKFALEESARQKRQAHRRALMKEGQEEEPEEEPEEPEEDPTPPAEQSKPARSKSKSPA